MIEGDALEAVLAMDAALMGRILTLPHPDWLNWVFLSASRAGTGRAIWLVAHRQVRAGASARTRSGFALSRRTSRHRKLRTVPSLNRIVM